MIWRITKSLNGKTYFYVGRENRGRRVWSTNIRASAFWLDKETATTVWETEANTDGAVTGAPEHIDEIEAAWLRGSGWVI